MSCCSGLAETLRQEMLLYSVDVHIYFPGTIHSPGYVEENRTKPPLLLELEATDEGLSPEKAAEGLYGGTRCLPCIYVVAYHGRPTHARPTKRRLSYY